MGAMHGVHPFVYIQSPEGRALSMSTIPEERHSTAPRKVSWLERRHAWRSNASISALPCAGTFHRPRHAIFRHGRTRPVRSPCTNGSRQHGMPRFRAIPVFSTAISAILEVLAPRVSKASAIRRVAKAEGAERIVVFGDNLNDLPMFCSGRHCR